MTAPRDANTILKADGADALRKLLDGGADVLDIGISADRDPKFPLVAFADLKPGTRPPYAVRGLIPRVGLIVAWGPPKCGKSFWAFSVAMHVALQWDWHGRKVHGGSVVYCAFEGADGFKRRAAAFRQRFLADHTDHVPFYLSPAQVDLVVDHAELIASIGRQVSTNPVLVVLDTLNRSLRGSENDDRDMSGYVRAADAIRERFNCAVLIVHHCGVDGTRPRGHTSLAGAVDAQLAVKRDTNGNICITVEWMKDGPEGDALSMALERVELGTDDDGELITSCVVVPAQATGAATTPLKGAPKVAYELLQRAILDDGSPAPASNHIPPGSRTTSLVRWRSYCDAGTVTSGDTPDAKRKAFVRAVERLQTLGVIGIWNDYVWIAGHAGH